MPKFQDPSSKKRKIQDSKPAKTRKAAPVQDASVSAVVVPVSSFEELSLPGFLQKAISDLGATALSPLQRQAIPALIAGKDVTYSPTLPRYFLLRF